MVDEVLGDRAGIVEQQRLRAFLESAAEVVDFHESDIISESLSPSDQFSLTYSLRNRADWLVVDERLLRRVATANGIAVIAVLGLLVPAVRTNVLSRKEALEDLEKAVSEHTLRISTSLYQTIFKELNR